jgi:hypothetical protein
MPWKKGQSGNPKGVGVGKEKLMRQALMMELKSTGEDLPELRSIARNVIDEAKSRENDNWFGAAKELWDRIDGNAPVMLTDDAGEFRKALDMSDDELDAIIEQGLAAGVLSGGAGKAN